MVFQERTYSVLIVTASDSFVSSVMPLLPVTDYWPVTTVRSVSEARRRIVETDFDIVLINAPLPDDFGMRLAIDICTNSGAGVLLMVKSDLFNDIYAKVVSYGVITLSKPTNLQMVAQNLRILCATRERMRQMQARQATVEEKIEEICQKLDEQGEASLFFLLKDSDSRSELVARFMGILELIKLGRINITTVNHILMHIVMISYGITYNLIIFIIKFILINEI